MKTLKTLGWALGQKGGVAAKIAVLTIGTGAAVTGVVVLTDDASTQSPNPEKNTKKIEAPVMDFPDYSLDLQNWFYSPFIGDLIESEDVPIETASAIEYEEPAVPKEFNPEIPEVKLAEPAELISSTNMETSQFQGADKEYFEKYGLTRSITPAEFVGGERELIKYIEKSIEYPEKAFTEGVEGLVEVGFAVLPDGSISEIEILNGVREDINKEAIRIIEELPEWKPREINSEKVKAYLKIPIRFEIN